MQIVWTEKKTWLVTLAICAASAAAQHRGILLSEQGLATNRAWVSPCIWGILLITWSVFVFCLNALFGRIGRNEKVGALCCIAIGSTPSVVTYIYYITAYHLVHAR